MGNLLIATRSTPDVHSLALVDMVLQGATWPSQPWVPVPSSDSSPRLHIFPCGAGLVLLSSTGDPAPGTELGELCQG